jgi:hypothetical protein
MHLLFTLLDLSHGVVHPACEMLRLLRLAAKPNVCCRMYRGAPPP